MSKLTKAQAAKHTEAQALLGTPNPLTHDDKLFVLEHWREDARHINSTAGAFFTPWGLALDFALDALGNTFTWRAEPVRIIDLCSGIGTLSLACQARHAWDVHNGRPPLDIVCVETNADYVAAGRRIVPEARWVHASVFDLPDDLGRFDLAISNPPFGRLKRDGAGPRYTGGEFEYHVIDVASSLAGSGAFILPQMSAGFALSGKPEFVGQESKRAAAFQRQTGIDLQPGMGIDTSYTGYGEWHGVAPNVEVALCDFDPPVLIELPDQTCAACGLEHPGADCQQPDLFGGAA